MTIEEHPRKPASGGRAKFLIGGLLIIAATISFIVAVPLYLTRSEPVLIAALVVTNIVAAAPFGAAAAAMQEMSPKPMRGQAAALLVFLLNFVGLGLGPPAVALVTDNVFRDPARVSLSLLIVSLVGRSIAALSVAGGLAAHRRAVSEVCEIAPETILGSRTDIKFGLDFNSPRDTLNGVPLHRRTPPMEVA
jgi:MFS family permease